MAVTRFAAGHEVQKGFFDNHDNIQVYVPNLIGYARVVFALYAFASARSFPVHLAVSYFLSFVCDELDGRFARKLGQVSTLGMVLDMVTDRVATTCLLAVLCLFYPAWLFAFLVLIHLDIFSHWFQMYATLAAGDSSHKDVESSSAVVRFYYRNRLFMGFCCVCCEVLYLALYLAAWPEVLGPGGVTAVRWVAILSTPGVAIKQFVNVIQLRTAASQLVCIDLEKRRIEKRGD